MRYIFPLFALLIYGAASHGAVHGAGHEAAHEEGLDDGLDILEPVESSLRPSWRAAYTAIGSKNRADGIGILSRMEIFGKFAWRPIPSISFNGELLLVDNRGFTQSIYDREDKQKGVNIREGYFEWSPLSSLYLHLGNKNQAFFDAPLLITDTSFPALAGVWDFYIAKAEAKSVFQAAVLNNASDALKRASSLAKRAPLFLTGSLFFNLREPLFLEELRHSLTWFYFRNLPASVAEKSRIGGNSIVGQGADGSSFEHKFYGLHNTLKAKGLISSKWMGEIGLDWLYNFGAPKELNQGGRVFSSLLHDFYGFMELKLTGALFGSASDSSVAAYNTELYAHNNRKGWLASIEGHLYDSSITLSLSFIQSHPIKDSRSMLGESTALIFAIRTNYASI